MTHQNFGRYVLFMSIMGVLAVLAIIGMVQIFNAADEARHSVKVTQCQNIVLGEFVHTFHVAIAKIELAENDLPERRRLLNDAIREPDIAIAMKACNHA